MKLSGTFKKVYNFPVGNLFWSREYNSAKEICKYASFSKVGGNYTLDLKIIWSSDLYNPHHWLHMCGNGDGYLHSYVPLMTNCMEYLHSYSSLVINNSPVINSSLVINSSPIINEYYVSNLFWSREYNSAKEICKYPSFSKVGGNYPLDLKIIWNVVNILFFARRLRQFSQPCW
jgi:hypothetical protein